MRFALDWNRADNGVTVGRCWISRFVLNDNFANLVIGDGGLRIL